MGFFHCFSFCSILSGFVPLAALCRKKSRGCKTKLSHSSSSKSFLAGLFTAQAPQQSLSREGLAHVRLLCRKHLRPESSPAQGSVPGHFIIITRAVWSLCGFRFFSNGENSSVPLMFPWLELFLGFILLCGLFPYPFLSRSKRKSI